MQECRVWDDKSEEKIIEIRTRILCTRTSFYCNQFIILVLSLSWGGGNALKLKCITPELLTGIEKDAERGRGGFCLQVDVCYDCQLLQFWWVRVVCMVLQKAEAVIKRLSWVLIQSQELKTYTYTVFYSIVKFQKTSYCTQPLYDRLHILKNINEVYRKSYFQTCALL